MTAVIAAAIAQRHKGFYTLEPLSSELSTCGSIASPTRDFFRHRSLSGKSNHRGEALASASG
jgi:hypothetical protein